ncbi:hypothetical protein F5J12DRAFT_338947 [Pisolithus orientalis]|uniref:uncharacterized protein n=1 Tax=Pisolithus orientalis TaxID=936130 RepID=UPI002225A309|nr:uncharacterized protein F5J12DRAFT_338947 [Pisolithus orientalis]KAI5997215.1 hypothetical protein F5J12DRAFT_338947 [Pisolithus orientalis]
MEDAEQVAFSLLGRASADVSSIYDCNIRSESFRSFVTPSLAGSDVRSPPPHLRILEYEYDWVSNDRCTDNRKVGLVLPSYPSSPLSSRSNEALSRRRPLGQCSRVMICAVVRTISSLPSAISYTGSTEHTSSPTSWASSPNQSLVDPKKLHLRRREMDWYPISGADDDKKATTTYEEQAIGDHKWSPVVRKLLSRESTQLRMGRVIDHAHVALQGEDTVQCPWMSSEWVSLLVFLWRQ